jgi:hypothetical protein
MADEHTGEAVHIALLAREKGTIRDREFVDCDINGPAVLYLGEETALNTNSWDGDLDAILWRIEPGRARILGAINVERTTFVGCRFHNIGIAASPEMIPTIRLGFEA